ncbi:MAG TPA: uroporphyrinogen-III C-methyltransferase [Gammaproteobacteria bacterium]|nr:uroporphyrinogen-III C-methyltransferase [Gammaproteobacteria bacterium]
MAEDKENGGRGPAEEEVPAAEEAAGGEAPEEAAEAAEAGEQAEAAQASAAGKPPRPRRAGAWLGGLALLAALGAAGAGGYAYWRLDHRLERMNERLAAVGDQGRQAQQALGGLRDELSALRKGQDKLGERADRLAKESDSLRQATQDLYARIEGGPTYWRLERLESLLVAADRVERLEHDPKAAYAALSEADRMLRELKDPAWLDVRKAVQDAMTRLEQVPAPDVPGIAFRLASLGDAALDLPLKRQQPPAFSGGPEKAEAGGEEAPPKGMWNRVKAALAEFWSDIKGLVRLRRSGEDIEPLLPPDKAAFLRHNLVLNLQAARLALLEDEPRIYRQSLTAARDWVNRFFDADSDEVAGMLSALKDLEGRTIAPDLPSLDKPLKVFRRVRQERGS